MTSVPSEDAIKFPSGSYFGESNEITRIGGTIYEPTGNFDPTIPVVLPHEQVYSIQVGSKLFKLSGASLSSDAPSYFTNFFLKHQDLPESERPTLYIDRDDKVFEQVALHLKGYYLTPVDETMFMYLYIDAGYYHLPRLIKQLYSSEIFIRIGCIPMRIPRNIFSGKGDSPNFFTAGFSIFFKTPDDLPKGIRLIRPPPLVPPAVPNRSGELFQDLLAILRGTNPEIRSEEHRKSLIAECRYYRLRGLEQKLVKHKIEFNQFRGVEEITIQLGDIKPIGISLGFLPGGQQSIHYSRPYVDEISRELLFQITATNEVTLVRAPETGHKWIVMFAKKTKTEIDRLIKKVSEISPFAEISPGHDVSLVRTYLEVDGEEVDPLSEVPSPGLNDIYEVTTGNKRPHSDSPANLSSRNLVLTNSIWRILRMAKSQRFIFQLVTGVGHSNEKSLNKCRTFL